MTQEQKKSLEFTGRLRKELQQEVERLQLRSKQRHKQSLRPDLL